MVVWQYVSDDLPHELYYCILNILSPAVLVAFVSYENKIDEPKFCSV